MSQNPSVEQKQFVLLNLLVVTFVLGLFVFRKRPQRPTQLNLNTRKEFKKSLNKWRGKRDYSAEEAENITLKHIENSSEKRTEKNSEKREVRLLNCQFAYNGHTWDAFEVLGIPAGASLEMAKQALHDLLKKNNVTSHEFIRTAFEAIVRLYQRAEKHQP